MSCLISTLLLFQRNGSRIYKDPTPTKENTPAEKTNSSEDGNYGKKPGGGHNKGRGKPVADRCHLGDNQVPPCVRCLPHNRKRYHQIIPEG